MEWLLSEMLSGLLAHISNSIKKLIVKIRIKKKLEKVARETKCAILSEFQNEVYFNELDKFLHNNKIISNYIQNCNSTGVHDYENIEVFIDKRIERFILQYPQFFSYKSSIKSMLQKIFILIFNKINQIDNEELNKVTNIFKEHVSCLENSLKKIETKIDQASRKNEEVQKIIANIEKDVLKENSLSVQIVSSIITAPFSVPDIDLEFVCKRQKVIGNILEQSTTNDWIHLIGSVWSGKTYSAMLVRQVLNSSLWIDFSLGNEINIIRSFEAIFKNIEINSLPSNVVIIDNLPELTVSSPFTNLFESFVYLLNNKGFKIISFGNHTIPTAVSLNNKLNFHSMNLPEFCADDVIEIMEILNAPAHLTSNRASEFFLELSGKKPAAIMIILHYLKSNHWDINSENFSKLLNLDIEELRNQIGNIITATISDDKTRELLYRISLVGHPVNRDELNAIANIEPPINLVGERINNLKGLWVSGDKLFAVNGLVKNFARDNTDEKTKIAINNIIADSILSKHKLDQLDTNNLICHLMAANRINEAGQIYITAMKSMCEERIEYNETFLFSKIWYGMSLPENMDELIKALIRFYQIQYDAIWGKKNDYAIADLIRISDKNEVARELMLAGGALLILSNHEVAVTLITEASSQGLNIEQKLLDEMDINPIEAICAMMFISMDNLKDIEEWFSFAKKHLTDDIIQKLEVSEYSHFFHTGLEKVRIKTSQSEIDTLIKIVEELKEYASVHKWIHLLIGCNMTLMRIEGINKSTYISSKELFKKYIVETDNDSFCANMQYCIGLLAVDNNDYDFSIENLCSASTSEKGLDDVDKIICCVSCSIVFSNLQMWHESQASLKQALTLCNISQNIEKDIQSEFLLKIHFERLICFYLAGDISGALDSLDYVCDFFQKNEAEKNKQFIAIVCHFLTYIAADLLKKDPPKHLGEEEYMPPKAGCIWHQNRENDIKCDNSDLKNTMIFILSAQLFDYYGEKEIALKYLKYSATKLLTHQKNETLYLKISLDSYPIYELLNQNDYKTACDIFVNTINCLSDSREPTTMLTKYDLAKFSFYLVYNKQHIREIYNCLKEHTISDEIKDLWNSWLESIELYINSTDGQILIEKANKFKKNGKPYSQLMCYIFATDYCAMKPLLELYLIVFSAVGTGLFNDVYWMNNILTPVMRRQTLKCNFSSTILDLYAFDNKSIKQYLKELSTMIGEEKINPELIDWLNSQN